MITAETKNKDGCYTIEREFLNRISITELIGRIIKAHVSEVADQEAV